MTTSDGDTDTFCLVHGAWHDDACWGPLAGELQLRGHRCLTPVLPLHDREASFEDYAAAVVGSLEDVEPAILVGHSLSSAVVALAPASIRVKSLVYLCPAMFGFPPVPGEPPYLRAGYERPPVNEHGDSYWPRDRAVRELYGRVERGLAEQLAVRLRPQPHGVFDAPYPLERPPPTPSFFLYGREDEMFDDGWSRWICRELLGVEPIELPSGHFPMLEDPGALADILVGLTRRDAAT